MADQNDSVDINTGVFGLKLAGPNSMMIALLLALFALAAVTWIENANRRQEHIEITCLIKLNVFIYTLPKGTEIQWSNMPVDLYQCIPKFLYERPVNR